MIYLGYAVQAFIVSSVVGIGVWGLLPAPRPLEAFTVDAGELVIA